MFQARLNLAHWNLESSLTSMETNKWIILSLEGVFSDKV